MLRSHTRHRAAYTFASATDTEVVLTDITREGIDGLVDRIRGIFAFALWDDSAQMVRTSTRRSRSRRPSGCS